MPKRTAAASTRVDCRSQNHSGISPRYLCFVSSRLAAARRRRCSSDTFRKPDTEPIDRLRNDTCHHRTRHPLMIGREEPRVDPLRRHACPQDVGHVAISGRSPGGAGFQAFSSPSIDSVRLRSPHAVRAVSEDWRIPAATRTHCLGFCEARLVVAGPRLAAVRDVEEHTSANSDGRHTKQGRGQASTIVKNLIAAGTLTASLRCSSVSAQTAPAPLAPSPGDATQAVDTTPEPTGVRGFVRDVGSDYKHFVSVSRKNGSALAPLRRPSSTPPTRPSATRRRIIKPSSCRKRRVGTTATCRCRCRWPRRGGS